MIAEQEHAAPDLTLRALRARLRPGCVIKATSHLRRDLVGINRTVLRATQRHVVLWTPSVGGRSELPLSAKTIRVVSPASFDVINGDRTIAHFIIVQDAHVRRVAA